MTEREPYPTDVSDEEWSFVALYLTLMNKDAPQRRYELREMFNALRWMARAAASCRIPQGDFLRRGLLRPVDRQQNLPAIREAST